MLEQERNGLNLHYPEDDDDSAHFISDSIFKIDLIVPTFFKWNNGLNYLFEINKWLKIKGNTKHASSYKSSSWS